MEVSNMEDEPTVNKIGAIDMQVCVPKDWTDSQVMQFAESENPCGTRTGWQIRKEGNEHLDGMPERNPCGKRKGFVHIMLDA